MADQKKQQKFDRVRNSSQNKAYKAGNMDIVNKVAKLIRHLRRRSADVQAIETLRQLFKDNAASFRDGFRKVYPGQDWKEYGEALALPARVPKNKPRKDVEMPTQYGPAIRTERMTIKGSGVVVLADMTAGQGGKYRQCLFADGGWQLVRRDKLEKAD